MKKHCIVLLALACLAACTTPKYKSDTPYQDYVDMRTAAVEQLTNSQDVAQSDSIIEALVEEGYGILMDNINNEQTDSIVLDIFYLFSDEQKDELFKKMKPARWESEDMKKVYDKYHAEQQTAAGKPYVDVVAVNVDGNPVHLSDIVGTADYVLVDFWASWCGPCRRLIPELKELYAEYYPTGKLQIVGISVDAQEADWLKALEEEQMPWPQLHDLKEEPYYPSKAYGISAIPTTFLIDREGKIVARNASEEEIAEILNK